MKFGKLKKLLKQGNEIIFKDGTITADRNYKYIKGRRKYKNTYTFTCYGKYNSYYCETEEYTFWNNKEIKEWVKKQGQNYEIQFCG